MPTETPNQKVERVIREARDRGYSADTTLRMVKGCFAFEHEPPLTHDTAMALISKIYGEEP